MCRSVSLRARRFTDLFKASIAAAERCEAVAERLEHVHQHFTEALFAAVCRSLFEKDKLLFAFLLAVRILQAKVPMMCASALLPTDTSSPAHHDWNRRSCAKELRFLKSLSASCRPKCRLSPQMPRMAFLRAHEVKCTCYDI